jgi:hypothetical protein
MDGPKWVAGCSNRDYLREITQRKNRALAAYTEPALRMAGCVLNRLFK